MELSIETPRTLSQCGDLLELLQELLRARQAEWGGPSPASGAARTLVEQALASPHGLLLCARPPGDSPAGILLVGPRRDPLTLEEEPCLLLLWSAPALRHRGLARRLVHEARARLRKGLSLAVLLSSDDDARIAMFERFGFERRQLRLSLEA